jgi:CheY-like chemotaxis protein
MSRVILVIEDDRDSRQLLKHFLVDHGYAVVTACNGLEGLQAARTCRPALILLDLHMPVMDGPAFRRHQRADPELSPVPVICVSAVDNASAMASQLGAVAHYAKPIDFEPSRRCRYGVFTGRIGESSITSDRLFGTARS